MYFKHTLIKSLHDIQKVISINDKFIEKFTTLATDDIVISNKLANVLAKLVISSHQISDTETEIISLLKQNQKDFPKLIDLVTKMQNKTNNNKDILLAIKEQLETKTTDSPIKITKITKTKIIQI